MQIDPNNLKTPTNYAKEKGLVRQHVYRLIKSGELNGVQIDGVWFVIMDEKAENFKKKRS